MEPFESENSNGNSPTEQKIKRTNPAKLMAIGFLKKDQIAKDVLALSQEPKMSKVPLRTSVVATAIAPATKPTHGENVEEKYPNVIYAPFGAKTGIFKKGARASLSAIDEVENEDSNDAGEQNDGDANATI